MAKKKSAKGKGSTVSHARQNSSPPSSSVSKSLSVAKQRPDSDSTAGKAASDLSPAIDAQTAVVEADPAMEIVSPNLENLATEVTVPISKFSDTTSATNTGIETVIETTSPQDRQDVHVPSPANPTASPSTSSPAELWKGFTKAVYRPVSGKSTDVLISSDATTGKKDELVIRTPPHPKRTSTSPRRAKEMGIRMRSLSPTNNQSPRVKAPQQSPLVEFNDLRDGGLCVDLSPYADDQHSNDDSLSAGHSSGHVSEGSKFSGEEDNPDDGNDNFQSLSGSLAFRESLTTVPAVFSSISLGRSKRDHLNSSLT
ncbi:hypothetical protein DY000_02029641 [Brassica cretica]|uniref:Uncharacterized protein n=1 Tax=Brassica cretica TaxID=69181 RepID=A0ABQ7DI35_BRACR|nr:hypothetical protein DY000_02029641 [Brassica cretica]